MKKTLLSLALGLMATGAFAETLTEVITIDCFKSIFDVKGTNSYQDVTYTSPITGITYKGNMAKSTSANGGGMQMRISSNTGLVSTENPSGAKIVSVSAQKAEGPSTSNVFNIYGSDQMYTSISDLFTSGSEGTVIASGSTTVDASVSPDKNYIGFGFRSTKGSVYIKSITITYQVGEDTKKAAGLEFSESLVTAVLGEAFTAPTLSKETNAAIEYTSSNEEVAEVDAETGEVTIKAIGEVVITATSEETDDYYPGSASYTIQVIQLAKAELATSMSDGKFLIVTPEGVAKNFQGANTQSYGYLYLDTDVKAESGAVSADEDYFITFTRADEGYTMQDVRGKYLGMDASHAGAFNFYNNADQEGSNCYWTVTFEGEEARIENTGREGFYISYTLYNNVTWELATTDAENQPLVQLYKSASTGVEGVAAEIGNEEGEAVYYNLQGVRVAEPANGLYIVRRGNKVSKEIIR